MNEQTQIDPKMEVSITLPISAWMTVGQGLGELPHKMVAGLVVEIDRQLNAAVQPKVETK